MKKVCSFSLERKESQRTISGKHWKKRNGKGHLQSARINSLKEKYLVGQKGAFFEAFILKPLSIASLVLVVIYAFVGAWRSASLLVVVWFVIGFIGRCLHGGKSYSDARKDEYLENINSS